MYFLRVGEPYVRKASDGSTAGSFPARFIKALEEKQIKGYWFVVEGTPKLTDHDNGSWLFDVGKHLTVEITLEDVLSLVKQMLEER